ncbi:MAG: hypothetical protein ACLQFR_13080 [Streptosporangiaceae bacterium]
MRIPRLATRSVIVISVPLLLAGVIAGIAPATAGAAPTRPAGPATSLSISGDLRGVASTSASDVWAVGSASSGKTLILRWNGKAWKRVPSPSPAGSYLAGVAATSARNAWAVGSTASGKTLILRWNGTAWKRVPSPSGTLSGVAAVSATDAWAVGGKLILHWNGTAWKSVPSPSLKGTAYLNAVAVTSGSNAWAVGEVVGSMSSAAGLILHWDGKAWSRVRSPTPSYGKYGNALEGVAATSAGNAWAVGCTDGCPVGGTPQIERWRGTSWKQVAAPTTPYALYSLAGVAATSGNAWAVGGGGPVTSESTATVHWNGRGWTLSHARSGAGLGGVTAISAKDAWAVGGTASGRTLILHWNGTTWS